jgi:hypothetical protein
MTHWAMAIQPMMDTTPEMQLATMVGMRETHPCPAEEPAASGQGDRNQMNRTPCLPDGPQILSATSASPQMRSRRRANVSASHVRRRPPYSARTSIPLSMSPPRPSPPNEKAQRPDSPSRCLDPTRSGAGERGPGQRPGYAGARSMGGTTSLPVCTACSFVILDRINAQSDERVSSGFSRRRQRPGNRDS